MHQFLTLDVGLLFYQSGDGVVHVDSVGNTDSDKHDGNHCTEGVDRNPEEGHGTEGGKRTE